MDRFTKKYSLSKTLRFELKPVGETAEHLEDFKNQALAKIVKQDEQRAKDYKVIKKIIDDYHRYFIEQVLSNEILTKNDIQNAFGIYTKSKSSIDKNINKEYEDIQKKLRKKIADAFAKWAKEFKLFEKELINESGSGKNKKKGKLYQWLKDSNQLDEKTEKLISNFDKFYTYFTGFNENRKNMYSADDKQTAISYRIVHDNMAKHFNNYQRFEKIKKDFAVLYENIKQFEDDFKPSAFGRFLNQTGIDKYNYNIIGRPADDEKAKRVNMLINEYIQTNNLKGNKRPPKFTQLFKQILSDKTSNIIIDEFENDNQMLKSIKSLIDEVLYKKDKNDKNFFNRVDDFFGEYMLDDFREDIYIKKAALTNLSAKIWGGDSWNVIRAALNNYAENNLSTKKDKGIFGKKDAHSISFIQKILNEYIAGLENNEAIKIVNILDYLKKSQYYTKEMEPQDKNKTYKQVIDERLEQAKPILQLDELGGGKQRHDNLHKLKMLLDGISDFERYVKDFNLNEKQKDSIQNINTDFYDTVAALHEEIRQIVPLYNKTRNYVTKKPYKTDKFKINFGNPDLLGGWPVGREKACSGIILIDKEQYYLGIIDKKFRSKFTPSLAKKGESYYKKMYYLQAADPGKDVQNFMVIDGETVKKNGRKDPEDGINYILEELKNKYLPKTINVIRKNKSYSKTSGNFRQKDLEEFIDYYKQRAIEYYKDYDFKFNPTSTYRDFGDFTDHINAQAYQIKFKNINKDYIDDLVKQKKLYLFWIYNKDFSPHSKGKPNLHTSYWKLLFEEKNLNNIVLKLNGQAEIFFRPVSLKKRDVAIHKANQSICNKNPLNTKEKSTFGYDIIKDRRFAQDKFFFHCPITLNFKSGAFGKFNDQVNEYLANNSDVKIIGIDRGERHLLYYAVVEPIKDEKNTIVDGKIIEQGSFNTITNSYKANGKDQEITTNYHSLLNEKEKQRDKARKSWSTIENIKELKSGYLSHIVHKIANLMTEHNAIVVLENLNIGFKRGRFKVEKQVYQKFEKALIDKLNYLVFKNKEHGQPGHYLNAYQLTAPFVSFKKLGTQTGFLFYVMPDYTSVTDPITGFVNRLYSRYESAEKSRDFFNKFDNISYNKQQDYFKFSFNYSKFPNDRTGKKKKWTVCTHGDKRYRWSVKDKAYKCYNVTNNLKTLFKTFDFENGKNLLDKIVNISNGKNKDAEFFRSLMFNLSLTLQLRHSYKDGDEEKDFILSPVADEKGNFFDSRKADSKQPANADANGAFNIARKGLMVLDNINKNGKPGVIKNAEWFDFAQKQA